MADDDNDGDGAIWNLDEAQARLIFAMKLAFIKERDAWNLDGAYWALWRLLTEIRPLFDDEEKKESKDKFNELTKTRNETDKYSNLSDGEIGDCLVPMNDLYEDTCVKAVEKKYYYRKKKEFTGL